MVTKSISTAQSHPAVSAEYVLIYAIAHCAHDTHVFDGKIFMKNRSEKKCANIFYECAPMMSCTRCTLRDLMIFGLAHLFPFLPRIFIIHQPFRAIRWWFQQFSFRLRFFRASFSAQSLHLETCTRRTFTGCLASSAGYHELSKYLLMRAHTHTHLEWQNFYFSEQWLDFSSFGNWNNIFFFFIMYGWMDGWLDVCVCVRGLVCITMWYRATMLAVSLTIFSSGPTTTLNKLKNSRSFLAVGCCFERARLSCAWAHGPQSTTMRPHFSVIVQF